MAKVVRQETENRHTFVGGSSKEDRVPFRYSLFSYHSRYVWRVLFHSVSMGRGDIMQGCRPAHAQTRGTNALSRITNAESKATTKCLGRMRRKDEMYMMRSMRTEN